LSPTADSLLYVVLEEKMRKLLITIIYYNILTNMFLCYNYLTIDRKYFNNYTERMVLLMYLKI